MSAAHTLVGDFVERAVPANATQLRVELLPSQLTAEWRRCGLTADWLAGYLAHDFDPVARASAKNVLSTVLNELIENCVKFCANGDIGGVVVVAASHFDALVRIETWNATSEPNASKLRRALEDLERVPLDSLFAQRIAAGKTPESPGIGLVIVRRDYGARIGAKLTPRTDGSADVHLSVELSAAQMTHE